MPRTITLLRGPQRLDLIPILLFHETVQRQALQPHRPLRGKTPRPLTRDVGYAGGFDLDPTSPLGGSLVEFLGGVGDTRIALDGMVVERARGSRAYGDVEVWISGQAATTLQLGFSARSRMPL